MYKNLNMDCLGISGGQSELIELALSHRFKGMDLDMVEFAGQVDTHGLDHARRLIASARIQIGTFRLPVVWGQWQADDQQYKAGMEALPRIAELAAGLGCSRCLTRVDPASDERPYHENFEFHRKRIGDIAEVLAPHGIRLGLEFEATPSVRAGRAFQFIHSLDALIQLAKMAVADNVGVSVDLWQLHVCGGSLDQIKQLKAEQIIAVFLADIAADVNLEEVDTTAQLLPGETGVIDSVSALIMLAELGYDGPVTPRASIESLGGISRDAKGKLAAERLDELWQKAGLNARGKLAAAAGS